MTIGPDSSSRPPVVEDANNVTVRLITSTTHAFSGEKLDKNKHNWRTWEDSFWQAMTLSLLDEYTLSDAKTFMPDKNTNPIAFRNWQQNDRRACAFIGSAISESEKIMIGGAVRCVEVLEDANRLPHQRRTSCSNEPHP